MRWLKRTNWQQTEGTVASIRTYGVGRMETRSYVFTYKVGGHWHSGTAEGSPQLGDTVTVRYDPDDPDRNRESIHFEIGRIVYWVFVAVSIVLLILFRSKLHGDH